MLITASALFFHQFVHPLALAQGRKQILLQLPYTSQN
jgi:hypothetical protein